MKITCTILGCGASVGTPIIGCKCFVCSSDNIKNVRKRASVLFEADQTKIIIDVGPDFKEQAISYKIEKLDAILFTHAHADHISGIDDVRPIVHMRGGQSLPSYMNAKTFDAISKSFSYALDPAEKSHYNKIIEGHIIGDFDEFYINDIKIQSFLQHHGAIDSLGYKIGNFAYSTDVIQLPPESFEVLKGTEYWIVDCLRYNYSPSHATLEQTLEWIEKVAPKMAILTHLGHEMDYDELKRILPSNVIPAYDGLIIQNY